MSSAAEMEWSGDSPRTVVVTGGRVRIGKATCELPCRDGYGSSSPIAISTRRTRSRITRRTRGQVDGADEASGRLCSRRRWIFGGTLDAPRRRPESPILTRFVDLDAATFRRPRRGRDRHVPVHARSSEAPDARGRPASAPSPASPGSAAASSPARPPKRRAKARSRALAQRGARPRRPRDRHGRRRAGAHHLDRRRSVRRSAAGRAGGRRTLLKTLGRAARDRRGDRWLLSALVLRRRQTLTVWTAA